MKYKNLNGNEVLRMLELKKIEMPLIRDFVRREAQDCGGKDIKWIESATNSVIKMIKAVRNKESNCVFDISSIGSGLRMRDNREFDRGNVYRAVYDIWLIDSGKVNVNEILNADW